jgi:hypothetical protein
MPGYLTELIGLVTPRLNGQRMAAFVLAALTALLLATPASTSREQAPPLADLARLVGAWQADAPGFSTTLRYTWAIEGHVLEAANEVRDPSGRVIARYHGSYAWDAGRKTIVFWTASAAGEVHRGRAWWQDDVLWHEAEVSGGRITSYASAVRIAGRRLEYFADYAATAATPKLLETKPIAYGAVTKQHSPRPGQP